MMNVTQPEHKFGLSQTHYRFPDIPHDAPESGVLKAANKLNNIRYQTLTHQQRVFVDTYLSNGFDPAEAAKEARMVRDVEDDKEARRVGRAMLRKKHINVAVEAALDYYGETRKISLDKLVEELKSLAFSNLADFFHNDGDGDPYLSMPDEDPEDPREYRAKMAAVAEIQVESYMEGKGPAAREVKKVKFKMHSKLEAIEKLLKIFNAQNGIADPTKLPQGGNTTNVGNLTVQTINVIPVPSGEFIPAPQNPYKVIDAVAIENNVIA